LIIQEGWEVKSRISMGVMDILRGRATGPGRDGFPVCELPGAVDEPALNS
jgi:hypothetical protein